MFVPFSVCKPRLLSNLYADTTQYIYTKELLLIYCTEKSNRENLIHRMKTASKSFMFLV